MALTVSTKRALLGSFAVPAPPSGTFGITVRGFDQQNAAGGEDGGLTYRFSAKDFGAVTPGRIGIIRLYAASGSASITAASIGGNACTAITTPAATSRILAAYYVALPSGSAHDIVITLSAAGARCAIEWATIDNTTQTAPAASDGATPRATASAQFLENSPALTPPAGGIVCAAAFHNSSTAGGEFTWSATTGTGTTNYNATVLGGPFFSTYDIKNNASNTVRASHSQTADLMRYLAFTWGP